MTTIIRETRDGLSVLVQRPASVAGAAIILLHGWGSDATDLMGLAPHIAARFPSAIIAAPDGPEPCSANPSGRQWFDLQSAKIDDGPYQAAPAITQLMDGFAGEFNLPHDRIALMGFSQGGMMALHVGMRSERAPAAIMAFSAALLAPARLGEEKAATAEGRKVLLVHGKDDEVVPHAALAIAEGMLKSAGAEVTAITRDGLGHGIDPDGLNAGLDFLAEHLPEKDG